MRFPFPRKISQVYNIRRRSCCCSCCCHDAVPDFPTVVFPTAHYTLHTLVLGNYLLYLRIQNTPIVATPLGSASLFITSIPQRFVHCHSFGHLSAIFPMVPISRFSIPKEKHFGQLYMCIYTSIYTEYKHKRKIDNNNAMDDEFSLLLFPGHGIFLLFYLHRGRVFLKIVLRDGTRKPIISRVQVVGCKNRFST